VTTPQDVTNASNVLTGATFTVSNVGAAGSQLTVSQISGVTAPWSVSSDACTGKALAQNQSCTVTLAASGVPSSPDTVTVTTADGQSAAATLVYVPPTTVQVYLLTNALSGPTGFTLDKVHGWGSSTLVTMATTGTTPTDYWNMYGSWSDGVSSGSTHAATIASASYPFAPVYPTSYITPPTSGGFPTTIGPYSITAVNEDTGGTVAVTLPQAALTYDANNVGSAEFCVTWALNSTQTWQGTPVLGACPNGQ
jgi:hypothetical protein